MTGALAGGLLAACGQGGGSEPAAPSTGAQAPATLRFAADKSRLDAGIQKVIDAFNARGGPIKVEAELVTGSLVDKILSQAAGGDAPDLTHTHPRDYHPWVNGGALLALDDYMKNDRSHVPDLVPTALEYWSREGKRWAMPNNLSVQNMYFNKELFDRRGVKYPDQYEKEGKWTFETYLDIARQLTSGSGDSKIFGATWMHINLDIQLGFIWPFGGDMWDKEQKRTLLDSKEALEAIQFQADLTHKYGVAPTADEWTPFASAPAATWGAAFSAGRAAMELQPNDSLVQHVVAATFPKGMAPMPKGRAGRAIRGLAVGAHITKGSKHPDAAWEFANYQSNKDSEKIMLDLHVSLPWHKSSLATLEKSMPLAPWENGPYYAEGVRQLRVTPYVPQFAEINRLYSTGYTEVRHGRKTAAELLTEIKPQIDSLLKP
ncbi:MAG: sugar ABC transporter substrate-binding protein [Chloroflexota bacterium]|nr:sugar ABC transporter substrate-binding protein [Chloroflexota bacterium]